MKIGKELRVLLGAALCIALLVACTEKNAPPAAGEDPPTGQVGAPSEIEVQDGDYGDGQPEGEATLCAVFGYPDAVERYPLGYHGDLTPQILMDALSELTGLDFEGEAYSLQGGIYVEWSNFSTLVTGLDGREQKEGFFLYDTESLRWFMMDSLWYTMQENFGDVPVYYSQEGRDDLTFDDLGPVLSLDTTAPYMGSNVYRSHSD